MERNYYGAFKGKNGVNFQLRFSRLQDILTELHHTPAGPVVVLVKVKAKGELHPRTGHKDPEGE
jgi:hypothetical protein